MDRKRLAEKSLSQSFPASNVGVRGYKMETGLLESLRKYRPREGNDPLENFITEAFGWILNNYPDFGDYFLKEISSQVNILGMDGKNCEWITQYNFNGVFPDMVCISNNRAIVFEHKTWSPLHENQIQNYRNYATRNFDESKVVLITATKYQHTQDPDLALCWSNVYELISTWSDTNNDTPFIFIDFLKLLKSEGMGPAAPISHESILYYYASMDIKQNISNIIRVVEKNNFAEKVKQDFQLCIEDKNRLSYGEAGGRMGLHLLNSWKPGIFIGILLDGNNYCTKPINIAKGPDFCLIIDFDSKLHNIYPLNAQYIKFVSNVSTKIATLNNGWEFYNHLNDCEAQRKNKWHPIHIRKSMLDVFIGTTSVEEQADIFYQTAIEVLKIVTDEDSFWKLRNHYR